MGGIEASLDASRSMHTNGVCLKRESHSTTLRSIGHFELPTLRQLLGTGSALVGSLRQQRRLLNFCVRCLLPGTSRQQRRLWNFCVRRFSPGTTSAASPEAVVQAGSELAEIRLALQARLFNYVTTHIPAIISGLQLIFKEHLQLPPLRVRARAMT